MRTASFSAICLLAALPPLAAQTWKMQYFYDKDQSDLTITDLKFSSLKHGVATGELAEKGKTKPVVLMTNDGGAAWSIGPVKDLGWSLFLLNDSLGWMVTNNGIWRTGDSGRVWKKLNELKGIVQVWFLDENHGFAAGTAKSIYETTDGGKLWTRIPASDQPSSSVDYTSYDGLAFADSNNGVIFGRSQPPRPNEVESPVWIDPEKAGKRRQLPSLSILLETSNAGRTWKSSVESLFGKTVRMVFGGGRSLALIQFENGFEWPCEVYQEDWRTRKITRSFREKNRAITDIALTAGRGFIAGYEPPGKLHQSPVPGAVKILTSEDLSAWHEMKVDYRAVATQVILAAVDAEHVWAATDTGMILKLESR